MRIIRSLVCVAVLALVAGCGGKDGSGSAAGRFAAVEVEGLEYTYGGKSGVTGPDGSFFYETGKDVTFSIGNIVLGATPGKATVTAVDLLPGATVDTVEVQDIFRLLMTLDSDSDPTNGITIHPDTVAAARAVPAVDFSVVTDDDLNVLLGNLHCPFPLVSRETAREYLNEEILAMYAGTYVGTGTDGTTSFSLVVPVASDGSIIGEVTTTSGTTMIEGLLFTDSTFVAVDVDGVAYAGTIDPASGKFRGTVLERPGSSFSGTRSEDKAEG